MSIVDPMIQQNPKIKIALIDKAQSGGSTPLANERVLTNRRMRAREEGIEL